jgi:hypothetical protein
MQVTEVRTVVRYSAEAKGAWRSIEVGATATLTASDETLESAQAELYNRLASQLKTLWYKGNGRDVEGIDVQPVPMLAQREYWCSEHGVEYKLHEKNGSSWYSHRKGATGCNEPKHGV